MDRGARTRRAERDARARGGGARLGMTVIAVVGAQWGDEGKGKVVDLVASEADVVARYGGGANAGHTLVVGGKKTVIRLVPSGVMRERTTCVLGAGMVIDPAVL